MNWESPTAIQAKEPVYGLIWVKQVGLQLGFVSLSCRHYCYPVSLLLLLPFIPVPRLLVTDMVEPLIRASWCGSLVGL